MTYNTFVKLRGVGCFALIAAPIALLIVRANGNKQAALPSVSVPIYVSQNAPSDPNGLSDVDREVLQMQKKPLSNGTSDPKGLKWRVKKGSVVIELRCDKDKNYNYWNRAKVDANNNKQFDETWAFKKDGTIERRVAPNDDQNYTQTFRLQGETWIAK